MRKIIRTQHAFILDKEQGVTIGETTALCNDGSLWLIYNIDSEFEDGWKRFPDIPQDTAQSTKEASIKELQSISASNLERLDVRTVNCLKSVGILTLFDIVQRKEYEVLGIPNLGGRSLAKIKKELADRNLHFDMKL